jgi:hypothetical protein
MKTLKSTIGLAILLMLLPLISTAQENPMYWIHVDDVKPSMAAEYEATVKEALGLLNQHNIQSAGMIVLATNDSKYHFISPIKNLGDVNYKVWKDLSEKAGQEVVSNLFRKMDKCYDNERDYVLTLRKELTYMPEGITQTPEGRNYRKNYLFYVAPGNRAAVDEKFKAVKEVYAKKGAKEYYRVYKSGFGADGEHYLVSIAAKDAMDYAKTEVETMELIGDEGKRVLDELFGSSLKYKVIDGYMRPDLAYKPK